MRTTPLIRPEYAESFRCIGPACEDTCCQGWHVFVDRATYEKYQTIPAGPLRTLMAAHVAPVAQDDDNPSVAGFAAIRMPASLECPFLSSERLCRIQLEHGEEYLSRTCAVYPRTVQTIDGLEETTLTLSCPEAARMVLLDPQLLAPRSAGRYHLTWDDAATGASNLRFYFWQIREFAIALVRNRAYPLWQRLFLLGTFSRRMEAIGSGGVRGFPEFLRDFSSAIDAGTLRKPIETISADLALQLDMVLQLVRLQVAGTGLPLRLAECLKAFLSGVGNGQATTLASQSALYGTAYRRYYEPFFDRNPWIVENLLINMILRRRFPLGARLADAAAALQPAREFASLATEFALIKGLLIGVAGARKEAFDSQDVVRTVQVACKHFEHNPALVDMAHQLLKARNLDNAHGLTMLLRN
jgi:lysine-N-methylase